MSVAEIITGLVCDYNIEGDPYVDGEKVNIDDLVEFPDIIIFLHNIWHSYVLFKVDECSYAKYYKIKLSNSEYYQAVFISLHIKTNHGAAHIHSFCEIEKYMCNNYGIGSINNIDILQRIATVIRRKVIDAFDEKQILIEFVASGATKSAK